MLAATKVKICGSERKKKMSKNMYDISSKTCNQDVSESFTLYSCKTKAEKCTKQVCCKCKVVFLLSRPIVVFSPFSFPSPLSMTRFYILFDQTIKIIESLAFSPG